MYPILWSVCLFAWRLGPDVISWFFTTSGREKEGTGREEKMDVKI